MSAPAIGAEMEASMDFVLLVRSVTLRRPPFFTEINAIVHSHGLHRFQP